MEAGAFGRGALLAIATAVGGMDAQAGVTISTAATQNVSCSGGVCSPTAGNAVLNVGDLQSFLNSGNIVVTTTGSGVEAKDIAIAAPFKWSKANLLTLDAHRTIAIDEPIKVNGAGGVSLVTNDGGTGGDLSFGGSGSIAFRNLEGSLSINGTSFALVGTIAALASGIASNPAGNFALAQSYDASGDGTYGSSPVSTQYSGTFEGLGNTILNLTINDSTSTDGVGLFRYVAAGTLRDLNLDNLSVAGATASIGGAAGIIGSGTIWGVHTTGMVTGGDGCSAGGVGGEAANSTITYSTSTARVAGGGNLETAVGGLVGASSSTIANSWATGGVTGSQGAWAGGLVGITDGGSITLSFATGQTEGGGGAFVGGLVGENGSAGSATITNSYATGAVSNGGGGGPSAVGGLVGVDNTVIAHSYSAGIAAGTNVVGGFVGDDNTGGLLKHNYWDMTTSGITDRTKGAGNIANDSGIKGLTNKTFKAGLPNGLDPKIWAETKGVNGGLPYLISNPPP